MTPFYFSLILVLCFIPFVMVLGSIYFDHSDKKERERTRATNVDLRLSEYAPDVYEAICCERDWKEALPDPQAEFYAWIEENKLQQRIDAWKNGTP